MRTTLFLHHGDDAIRGSEVVLIESIHAVLDAGGHARLMCNHPDLLRRRLPAGLLVEKLEFPELLVDGRYVSLPVLRYCRTLWQLSRRYRRGDIDLIYASSGLPCQLGWPLSRLLGVPLLAHFHHPAPKRYFYFWLVRWADSIVAPSVYTASVVRAKCGRESTVLYFGVDTAHTFFPRQRDSVVRAQLGFSDQHIVIGQVAALVPHKRPDLLIGAFARIAGEVPALRLVFVGGGSLQAQLQAQAGALGLADKIHVLGRVADVAPFYQDVFDINVLASESEGLGLSVVEASACGVPSVVSDSTGLAETVVDSVTGLHFKTGDEVALARALLRLARDADLRRHMGRCAVELAVRRFSALTFKAGIVSHVRALGGLP